MNTDRRNSKWDDLRKRAERVLEEHGRLMAGSPEADILGLIHELEVHQVELEIQGEELRLKNFELKELLHRYSDLYHQAPVGFVSLNTQGAVAEANSAACAMLDRSKSALKSRGFSHLVHIKDQAKYFEIQGGLNKILGGKGTGEIRLMRSGGVPFYAHVEIVPCKNELGEMQGWLVAFVDISRAKKAEEKESEAYARLEESQRQMKELSARLLYAMEEERKSVARDLHDSLGQTLAAMKFTIENAIAAGQRDAAPGCAPAGRGGPGRRPRRGSDVSEILVGLVPVIQGAMDEVRNIYSGLRPAMLDDLGISQTLKWFCRKFEETFPNIRVETAVDIKEKNVPEDIKIVIFRIVQEALNNIAKHSGAERVDVKLSANTRRVELKVQDDGKGFDTETAANRNNPSGVGLVSMKERAELSGGALWVESTEGRGTSIAARWDRGAKSEE